MTLKCPTGTQCGISWFRRDNQWLAAGPNCLNSTVGSVCYFAFACDPNLYCDENGKDLWNINAGVSYTGGICTQLPPAAPSKIPTFSPTRLDFGSDCTINTHCQSNNCVAQDCRAGHLLAEAMTLKVKSCMNPSNWYKCSKCYTDTRVLYLVNTLGLPCMQSGAVCKGYSSDVPKDPGNLCNGYFCGTSRSGYEGMPCKGQWECYNASFPIYGSLNCINNLCHHVDTKSDLKYANTWQDPSYEYIGYPYYTDGSLGSQCKDSTQCASGLFCNLKLLPPICYAKNPGLNYIPY